MEAVRPAADAPSVRLLLLVLLVPAVALASLGGAAPARAAGGCEADAAWGTTLPAVADEVLALVNAHRTALGLSRVERSPSLEASAVWKARHMAHLGYMSHDDPGPPVARSTGERIAACGYPVGRAGWGENIAYGYRSAAAVMAGWLDSPGHRANIERPSYRALGVGVARAADGTLYYAKNFGTVVGSAEEDAPEQAPAPAPAPVPARDAPRTDEPSRVALRLVRAPRRTTRARTATFRLRASSGATLRCVLDRRLLPGCGTHLRVSGLRPGRHSLRVIASRGGAARALRFAWRVRATAR